MEVRWNEARKKAGLAPAPFPTTTAQTVIDEPEEPDEPTGKTTSGKNNQ